LPLPWVFILWGVGLAIDLSIPVARVTRDLGLRYPPDLMHLSERFGLFTIIVLGESFVKVITEVSGRGAGAEVAIMGGLTLVVTCSLWWIYFDDVAGSRIKSTRGAPFIWIYTHLPMALAITSVGVAIKKIVYCAPYEIAPDKYRWLFCGTLALTLLTVGVIDKVTERRQAELSDRARVNVRIGSAFLVILLAPTGAFLPAWAFVGLVASLCFGQVIFDLLSAPDEADPEMAHQDALNAFAYPSSEEARTTPRATTRRMDSVANAVRRGTPNEVRRDLYFFLMEGSWKLVFAFLISSYLLINLVFAALYLLEPESIANARPDSFADAFFFSVQTVSTIGFGTLSPGTTWSNTLVVVEALTGVLFAAISTGLMFAKASRPSAKVLFSKVVVVDKHHGDLTLMFRVGNGRGNEIVDAHMRVSALCDEVSPEGRSHTKLVDLQLRRSDSPLFRMSWTVFHVIDENSPLYGIDWRRPSNHLVGIIVTMTGHDGTYAQTVYSRHIYDPEDLRYGFQFEDVISRMEDGRFLVDYTKFHSVFPSTSLEPIIPLSEPAAPAHSEPPLDDPETGDLPNSHGDE
ncbi:MAG: low temperature requirement protein A, partial [Myxococcales bacterium]|nr:low temperature requirement protein A [Myxococcales bacterium]